MVYKLRSLMAALAVFSKLNVVGVTLKGIENPADMRSEKRFRDSSLGCAGGVRIDDLPKGG